MQPSPLKILITILIPSQWSVLLASLGPMDQPTAARTSCSRTPSEPCTRTDGTLPTTHVPGELTGQGLIFFIISDSLLPAVSLCEISPFISTELFDHKSVSLTLNKPNFKPNQSISLSILSHPVFCMWWLVLQPSAISNMWTPMLRPTWRVWSWRGASKKSVVPC